MSALAETLPLRRKVGVVLGGGSTVYDDLNDLARGWPGWQNECVILAVNDHGAHWPARIDHWCTLHSEKLTPWKRLRAEKGYSMTFETWSPSNRKGVVVRHFIGWNKGSSGLYAVSVGLLGLGLQRILLCGVPMDPSRNVFSQIDWKSYDRYTKDWRTRLPEMRGRVVSFSGWTRQILGAPALPTLSRRLVPC